MFKNRNAKKYVWEEEKKQMMQDAILRFFCKTTDKRLNKLNCYSQ